MEGYYLVTVEEGSIISGFTSSLGVGRVGYETDSKGWYKGGETVTATFDDRALASSGGSGGGQNTDTSGLSVSITLPLPTELIPYGGSNRVISATDGVYERLGARFSTIDGVPVVTFSPPHFSPYGIYADLNNLDGGTIDATPKTGDPIHTKWFLVVGLVSVSLILFLKKERKPQLNTA